jgi:hypothetical protein
VPADSGTELEEDQARLSRAYNHSIYLMLGVPYLAVATVGFMVYRHLRVRAAWQQRLLDSARPLPPGPPPPTPLPGDGACSTTSLDGVS